MFLATENGTPTVLISYKSFRNSVNIITMENKSVHIVYMEDDKTK
jgi:hypothetical protein